MMKELKIRFSLFALTILAMLWGFQAMILHHGPDMFRSPEEDMSYAWYVPAFSLYVIWTEREKIFKALGNPSFLGALLVIPAIFVGFLGVRGTQLRLEILGFVFLFLSVTWTFFGRRAAASVAFPACFLFFCMPFNTYLDTVTVYLRLFGTSVAAGILDCVGLDIVRTGTMITAADGSFGIDVAAPCSGLRSLFAMMALTAGYAYFNQPTWFRRALLFALSIPIAIAGNIARILTIAFVGTCFDPDFATGFYHDYSGYVVFLVAIALMLATSKGIDGLFEASRVARRTMEESEASSGLTLPRFLLIPFSFLLCLLFFWQAKTPETHLMPTPEVSLPEIAGFTFEELPMSEAEYETLPKDTTIIRRRYTAPDGHWYQASAVIGGRSKSSVHRPELCLPGQGYQMTAPHTLAVGPVSWRVLTLERGTEGRTGFAYTFVNGTGFRTSSNLVRIFTDVWDRSIRGRIDRWVMLTVSSSRSDDAGLAAFLKLMEGVVK